VYTNHVWHEDIIEKGLLNSVQWRLIYQSLLGVAVFLSIFLKSIWRVPVSESTVTSAFVGLSSDDAAADDEDADF